MDGHGTDVLALPGPFIHADSCVLIKHLVLLLQSQPGYECLLQRLLLLAHLLPRFLLYLADQQGLVVLVAVHKLSLLCLILLLELLKPLAPGGRKLLLLRFLTVLAGLAHSQLLGAARIDGALHLEGLALALCQVGGSLLLIVVLAYLHQFLVLFALLLNVLLHVVNHGLALLLLLLLVLDLTSFALFDHCSLLCCVCCDLLLRLSVPLGLHTPVLLQGIVCLEHFKVPQLRFLTCPDRSLNLFLLLPLGSLQ
mmetsp:Transcript_10473/g.29778  ORF Transcript_10473/g.29778 Transcript_10473/m.29778 type:complete len:253 (+) Transcript_10473:258-1016(+)